jgi:hypothetical protein
MFSTVNLEMTSNKRMRITQVQPIIADKNPKNLRTSASFALIRVLFSRLYDRAIK